jgi:hypothetical protein
MNENLFLLMILTPLWSLLVGILGRNVYIYHKRKDTLKMILVLLMLGLVLLSGEWIVFLVWLLACDLGVNPFSCLL